MSFCYDDDDLSYHLQGLKKRSEHVKHMRVIKTNYYLTLRTAKYCILLNLTN